MVLLGGSRNLALETESRMPQKDGTALVASSTNLVTMATQSGTAARSTAEGGAAPHAGIPDATTCCTAEAQNNTIAATTAATLPNVLGTTASGVSPYERQQFLGGNPDPLIEQNLSCLNPGFFKSLEHSLAAKILLDIWIDREFRERLQKANPDLIPFILGECKELCKGSGPWFSEEALALETIGGPDGPPENFGICSFLPESCKVIFCDEQKRMSTPRQRPCKDLCFLYPRYLNKWMCRKSITPPSETGRLPKKEKHPYYVETLIWKKDGTLYLEKLGTRDPHDGERQIVGKGSVLWARYVFDKVAVRKCANEIAAKHEVVINQLLEYTRLDRKERARMFYSTFVEIPQNGQRAIAFLRSICLSRWSPIWNPLEEAFVRLLLNTVCIHVSENNKVPVLNHKCNSEATNASKECICDFWRNFSEPPWLAKSRPPTPLSAACTNDESTEEVAEILMDAAQHIRKMCELEETDNSQAGSGIFLREPIR